MTIPPAAGSDPCFLTLSSPFPSDYPIEVVGVRVSQEWEDRLLPPERAVAASLRAPNRRREFAAGRVAAHEALRRLEPSMPSTGIGQHESRGPAWPDGFCGSISHVTGMAVAAAAKTGHIRSLGIDVERSSRRVPDGLLERICLSEEVEHLRRAGFDRPSKALEVFTAKEAAFKGLSPFSATPLNLRAVRLIPRHEHGCLEVAPRDEELARSLAEFRAEVHITCGNDYIVAGFTLTTQSSF